MHNRSYKLVQNDELACRMLHKYFSQKTICASSC